jgi:acyl carrier protein
LSTRAQYNGIFLKLFNLANGSELSEVTYQSIPLWDSVGHMELIAQLESEFNIMLDMDDVIDFSSYSKGKEILKKYGVIVED